MSLFVSQDAMENVEWLTSLSITTPAAESYCAEAAKKPLYAAKMREDAKITKYFQAYKNMDDIHFEPFVVESGGELGERAQEIFKKICNLITQTTGQSGSSIAYFWKSRLHPSYPSQNHVLKCTEMGNSAQQIEGSRQLTNRFLRLLWRWYSRFKTDDAQLRI